MTISNLPACPSDLAIAQGLNGDLQDVIERVVKYSAGVFANASNIKYLQADLCNLLHFDCTRGTGPFNNQPTEWQ